MIYAEDIALYLNSELIGNNIEINNVSSLSKLSKNTIAFSKKQIVSTTFNTQVLILCPHDSDINKNSIASFIKLASPKLAFAKILEHFFLERKKIEIHHTAIIGVNCVIEENVSIGAYSVIGDNVKIGKNTFINNHVVIHKNTKIGEGCYIKSGTVIGEEGFGFNFEEDGTPIRVHHIGNVLIGKNVEIGANTVIARGTLDSTIIEDNVKVDDHVFIAHNCHIQEKTVIIASAEISGSVKVGKSCWIGPNCSIIQKVNIGNNAFIGIAANVTKDVADGTTVAGNPAKILR